MRVIWPQRVWEVSSSWKTKQKKRISVDSCVPVRAQGFHPTMFCTPRSGGDGISVIVIMIAAHPDIVISLFAVKLLARFTSTSREEHLFRGGNVPPLQTPPPKTKKDS